MSIVRIKPGTNGGFIALMTTIMIGAILLLLTAALARSGYAVRYQVLGMEYKTRSRTVSEGCVARALAMRLVDISYRGDATTSDSFGTCYVAPLVFDAGLQQLTIRAEGRVASSVTLLEYVYDMESVFMGELPLGTDSAVSHDVQEPAVRSRRELPAMP